MGVIELTPTAAVIVDRQPLPVQHEFGRIIHEWERLQSLFRTAVPEVFLLIALEAFRRVELTPELQRLWYGLFRYGAPSLSDSLAETRWTSLLWEQRAFTNGTGFGIPGDPRYNAITGANAGSPNPELDKDRLCGGMTVRIIGREVITWKNNTTGKNETSEVCWLDRMDPTSLPTLAEALKAPWLFFHSTICYKARTGMFPFGVQEELDIWEPTLTPLVTNAPVCYPSKWIQPFAYIADPYMMYLPLQSPSLMQAIRRLLPNALERVRYTFMS